MGKRKEISNDEIEVLKESFEGRLLLARTRKGISQSKLSELAHINDQTISEYERGNTMPRWDYALQLCEALDCDMNYLAGYISDYRSEKNKLIADSIGFSEDAIDKLAELKKSGSDLMDILSFLISNHTEQFSLFIDHFYAFLIANLYRYHQFTYQEGIGYAYDKCVQQLHNIADDSINDKDLLGDILENDAVFRDFIYEKKARKGEKQKS